jgi:hypothetical protein
VQQQAQATQARAHKIARWTAQAARAILIIGPHFSKLALGCGCKAAHVPSMAVAVAFSGQGHRFQAAY